ASECTNSNISGSGLQIETPLSQCLPSPNQAPRKYGSTPGSFIFWNVIIFGMKSLWQCFQYLDLFMYTFIGMSITFDVVVLTSVRPCTPLQPHGAPLRGRMFLWSPSPELVLVTCFGLLSGPISPSPSLICSTGPMRPSYRITGVPAARHLPLPVGL